MESAVAVDRAEIAAAALAGRVTWREHARRRAAERGFSPGDVISVLAHGDVVEDYSATRPVPAALLFGDAGGRPLHVVVASMRPGSGRRVSLRCTSLDSIDSIPI